MIAGALHSLKGMMKNLNRFSGMQNVVLAPSFSATSTCQYTLSKSLEPHRNANTGWLDNVFLRYAFLPVGNGEVRTQCLANWWCILYRNLMMRLLMRPTSKSEPVESM